MAVGQKPNVEYLYESLGANLKLIGTASGYWIDVQTVKAPNYVPYASEMYSEDRPALLYWIEGEQPEEGWIGMAERSLEVTIIGLIASDRSIRENLLRMVASVRKCLLFNRQLDFPGTVDVPNSWGKGVEEIDVSYQIESTEQSKAAGLFQSRWRIHYAYPSPSG